MVCVTAADATAAAVTDADAVTALVLEVIAAAVVDADAVTALALEMIAAAAEDALAAVVMTGGIHGKQRREFK